MLAFDPAASVQETRYGVDKRSELCEGSATYLETPHGGLLVVRIGLDEDRDIELTIGLAGSDLGDALAQAAAKLREVAA